MIRVLLGLGLGLLLLVTPAQASIIPVVLHFSDLAWSGSVSFDDTTGQPFAAIPPFGITAYAIVDMDISDGVHTWTEDELNPASVPPDGGLLVDPFGTVALAVGATDTASGATLGFVVVFVREDEGDPWHITLSELSSGGNSSDSSSEYTASVPEPATLLLLGSGLAGLGTLAWRRRPR